MTRTKLTSEFRFPLLLDLSAHLPKSAEVLRCSSLLDYTRLSYQAPAARYELVSVLMHSGGAHAGNIAKVCCIRCQS